MTDIATVVGVFLLGFGLGVLAMNLYWSGLVKDANDQVLRVLEQNQEFLDTWEPKRVVIRVKEWRG